MQNNAYVIDALGRLVKQIVISEFVTSGCECTCQFNLFIWKRTCNKSDKWNANTQRKESDKILKFICL